MKEEGSIFTSTTYANGVISVNTFDILDRLDKLTQYLPDATPADLSDNTVLAEFDYTLAADGTRIGLTERILKESGAGYDVNVFTWTYDNLNRLLSETLVSSIADFSYEANYVYSLSNNRVSYSVDHADNSKDQSVTYLYDANDRLVTETKFATTNFTGAGVDTTYTYSTAGEMIGKTVDGDPSQSETFTFNLQGRLASHTKAGVTTLFRYDTSGIRVASAEYAATDTLPDASAAWGAGASKIIAYLIDDQNHTGYAQVLEERNVPPGDVAALASVTKAYVLGMDVLQQFTPADAANGLPVADNLILLPDGHGSTRLLLASVAGVLAGSGLMVPGQRFFYDAYGNLLTPVGASTPLTTLLYTGEQRDSATGMYYLRARYYNPSMGRFASMDSWSGRYESLKDFNGYMYAGLSPANATDPSGFSMLATVLKGVAIGAVIGGFVALSAEYAQHGRFSVSTFGWGALYGAGFALLAMASPAAGIGLALWGVFGTANLVGDVFNNPNSTPEQKGTAIALMVASVSGLGVASAQGSIAYSNGSTVFGGSMPGIKGLMLNPAFAGIFSRIRGPLFGRNDNFTRAQAEALKSPPINKGRSEPKNPPSDMQVSLGGKFEGVKPGKYYLWIIDKYGNLRIAEQGSSVTGTKHSQLSAGDRAIAGGEIMFTGNTFKINPATSRFRVDSAVRPGGIAVQMFKALGYEYAGSLPTNTAR